MAACPGEHHEQLELCFAIAPGIRGYLQLLLLYIHKLGALIRAYTCLEDCCLTAGECEEGREWWWGNSIKVQVFQPMLGTY